MTTSNTYWRDLIHIAEHRSTFVLKLTEGLDNAAETIDKYVVTPELADRFDQALSLIDKAIRSQKSQGAFLHGSFGSGKSHFMAVLNLLLQGLPEARSIEALTEVVVKHDWMKQKRFLMVPYHMLGKTSMEAAVFDGYIEFIEKHHPDARLPGVFLADSIIENAESLRQTMGDDAFFQQLNASSNPDGWGEMEVQWDATTYQTAVDAGPLSDRREKLVGDIVRHILPSLRDVARNSREQKYVPFDEGLSIISRHAAELGYDGLILFLDELILWLSGKSADVKFLRQEIDKVPKLVESQSSDRAIPIISFIARQRELREMLGDAMTGEERSSMGLSVEWWQGRFDTVELEDRNLPVIASERLLRPRDQHARELIRQSFESFTSELNKSSRDTMLTSQHDEKDFELVFPFSPALVQSLIVLSATLQRDRTALKLMQTLLIEKRGELRLGDIIPVGDLWDVISEGDEPMNDLMRRMMRTARSLWEHKLRPVLERHQGTHDDARLLKTLLIAALVPKLEVFEDLTVERLLALNHGSVRAPIPGAEKSMAMRKIRNWASEINEISIQETSNPIIQVRLEDVDIEPLLKQADSVDSRGNRRRKIKELLYQWLELKENQSLRAEYHLPWRGGPPTAHIVYGNVREMSAERLTSDGDHWLIVLDYPFDEADFKPADDMARLQNLQAPTDTLVWLPSFLEEEGQQLLGRLLKIEDVLARFDEYSTNLRQEDRPTARAMLENSKHAVAARLELALHAAYGLSRDDSGLLDSSNSIDDHLYSCNPDFQPTIPYGRDFPDALQDLFVQALEAKYPAAHRLPDVILRSRDAEKIYDVIRTSIEADDGRAFVETKALRNQLVDIAEPLKLGAQGATHFVHSKHWPNEIDQKLQPGDDPISLGDLYALLDPEHNPTGLPHVLKDLIIIAYADMEDMLISRQGQELDPRHGSLRPGDKLERRRLPSQPDWTTAGELAERLFSIQPPRLRNARNVQYLAREITTQAAQFKPQGLQIADRLAQVAAQHLRLAPDRVASMKRYALARQMRALLLATDDPDPTTILESLARLDIADHDRLAIRSAMENAALNLAILNDPSLWNVVEKLASKPDRSGAESNLLDQVQAVIQDPEHARSLADLRELQRRIIDLVFSTAASPSPTSTPNPPPTLDPATPKTQHPNPKTHPPNTTQTFAAANKTQALDWLQQAVDSLDLKTNQTFTISIHLEDLEDLEDLETSDESK